jgi:hypothetical protein
LQKGAQAMAEFEILKDEVLQYINEMDEYQTRLILSFIKTLFGIQD